MPDKWTCPSCDAPCEAIPIDVSLTPYPPLAAMSLAHRRATVYRRFQCGACRRSWDEVTLTRERFGATDRGRSPIQPELP